MSTCRFVSSCAVASSGCPAGSRRTTIRRAARTRARMTEGAASVPYSVPESAGAAAVQHRPGRAYTLTRAPRTVRVPHSSKC
ncbi:hypothetical protein ACWGI9_29235, partial [Streptomyces sp. NPDC054833]